MLGEMLMNVKRSAPLIHNITNYVTANDCANITLACGASPIMADDRNEVQEITARSQALVLNTGTLREQTIPAMLASGKEANERNVPVVLDPVGIGASRFRREAILSLVREIHFCVIRGNSSEIRALYQCIKRTSYSGQKLTCSNQEDISGGCAAESSFAGGVDAAAEDQLKENNLTEGIALAQKLSQMTDSVIVMSGAVDLVTAANISYLIHNGHPMMSRITGSGCMLTSLIGAYCGANPLQYFQACTAAVCAMGICGEQAYARVIDRGGEEMGPFKDICLMQ